MHRFRSQRKVLWGLLRPSQRSGHKQNDWVLLGLLALFVALMLTLVAVSVYVAWETQQGSDALRRRLRSTSPEAAVSATRVLELVQKLSPRQIESF